MVQRKRITRVTSQNEKPPKIKRKLYINSRKRYRCSFVICSVCLLLCCSITLGFVQNSYIWPSKLKMSILCHKCKHDKRAKWTYIINVPHEILVRLYQCEYRQYWALQRYFISNLAHHRSDSFRCTYLHLLWNWCSGGFYHLQNSGK